MRDGLCAVWALLRAIGRALRGDDARRSEIARLRAVNKALVEAAKAELETGFNVAWTPTRAALSRAVEEANG